MKQNTRRNLIPGILLLGLSFLTACSSGVTVRSDSSPSADFSRYRTYGFFQPMGIEGGYNSPIFGELFRAAISSQMEARGYALSSEPDLLINVSSRLDDKVRVTSYTSPYLSGAYYGGGYYGRRYGTAVAVETRATVTEEASVFIDLVDTAADRISWQGVSVITLSDEKAQELQKTIDYSVNRIFELYPHTAGR
jgi:hypothetical protein